MGSRSDRELTVKKKKFLYKVTINYYGEIHVFYKHSITKAQALTLAIHSLEGRLKLVFGSLTAHVKHGMCKYSVELAKEER